MAWSRRSTTGCCPRAWLLEALRTGLCVLADGERVVARSDCFFHRAPESCLAAAENQLIALLPRRDRLRLLALCETVELARDAALSTVGSTTQFAYFPTAGAISLVATTLNSGVPMRPLI